MPATIVAYKNNKLLLVDEDGNYIQMLPETQPGNIVQLSNWIHENAASVVIGTSTEFSSQQSLVIPDNCLAIETDTGKMKLGDGSTEWSLTNYLNVTASKLTSRQLDGITFDGSANVNRYAVCSTIASTATKAVTVAGFNLVSGARIYVKFTYLNEADNPLLQVNNETAKAIVNSSGTAIRANVLKAGTTYCFVYNGTAFEIVSAYVSGGSTLDEIALSDVITGTDTTPMSIAPKTLSDVLNTMMAPVYMAKTEWLTSDPVVRGGVMAVESDTGRVKVGDGVSRYSLLPYSSLMFAFTEADELFRGYYLNLTGDGPEGEFGTASDAAIKIYVKDQNGDYNDPT